jgi:hypothetical protein
LDHVKKITKPNIAFIRSLVFIFKHFTFFVYFDVDSPHGITVAEHVLAAQPQVRQENGVGDVGAVGRGGAVQLHRRLRPVAGRRREVEREVLGQAEVEEEVLV